MRPDDLRQRFRLFARDAVLFSAGLFDRPITAEVARQLMRSARGAASMHRAAGRARSHREFTSTIAEALEEADEAQFWLQHLQDCSLAPEARLGPLLQEATELTAILTASYTTARGNDQADPPPRRRRRRGPDSHTEGAP